MTTWASQIIRSDPWRYLRLHVAGVGRMLGPDPDPLFRLLGWLGPDGRPLAHRTGYWRGAVALEAVFLGGLYGAALAGVGRAIRQGQSWLLLPALLTIGYAGVLGGPEVYPLCLAGRAGSGAPGRPVSW